MNLAIPSIDALPFDLPSVAASSNQLDWDLYKRIMRLHDRCCEAWADCADPAVSSLATIRIQNQADAEFSAALRSLVADMAVSGPVIVGSGADGLTPLQLVGRFFRVTRESGGESWCRCSESYAGYAADCGIRSGRLYRFSRVSLDDNGEWEARVLCLRADGSGYVIFEDIEVFRLLQWVDLVPDSQVDPQSWELLNSG